MTARVDHIAGHTWHGRKGGIENAFRYGIDYVCLDAEAAPETPALFSREGRNVTSLWDMDHGGPPGAGRGATWVRQVLAERQIRLEGRIDLLAQPRVLGHVFNPVSFWLCHDAQGALCAVIAEVTNTWGQRHSYLCVKPDRSRITAHDRLTSEKLHFVSPFQPVEGGYEFRFDVTDSRIGIRIDYGHAAGGLIATLTGRRRPLTNRSILAMLIRRPFGSRRVLALIHWQALKLWWKGARYAGPGKPPAAEIS